MGSQNRRYSCNPLNCTQLELTFSSNLVGQEGWAKVSEAVETVLAVSPTHLSTEKILAICKRNDDDVFNHKMDDTLILSKGILDIYSRLLNGSTNKFEQGVPVL